MGFDMESSVRQHHYIFANMVLNKFAFKNPDEFFSFHESGDSSGFLLNLWEETGKMLESDAHLLSSEGLEVALAKDLEDFRLMIIKMPPPENITEVFYVALVRIKNESADKPGLRYFTLEYHDAKNASLCEWTENETHINYGNEMKADLDGFVESVESVIQE